MMKAILFDLDGTLLNSLDDLADSANYALNQLGYPIHPLEAYRYFVGNGVDTLIERVLPEHANTPETQARMKEIYLAHYGEHSLEKTRPYDGIPEALRALRGRGLKLAVVSNKPDDQAKLTVARLLEDGLFDHVAGGGAGFPLKPDPGLTRHILGKLGIAPGESFFAGDTGIDMKTAKNAGCTAVGVTWGFRTREELLASGADLILDRPSELLSLRV